MQFYREISRVEALGLRLSYCVQSNPFEYELQTPQVPSRFSLVFNLPSGLHRAEFASLVELPALAKLLHIDIPALAAVDPIGFARMASSLDDQIASPLDPPGEWARMLEFLQASPPDAVSSEYWAEYHAAQRAFQTPYWPPSVKQTILSWVSTQARGGLMGVRLHLSSMQLEKETLQ